MLYLNTESVRSLNLNWDDLIAVVKAGLESLKRGDFSQPLKPYLRFKDVRNRIIAMPAYIGGEHENAGIKWIASFPGNIDRDIQRAHSVTILNCVDTGKPACIINSTLVSEIRTAAVTGLMIKSYLATRSKKDGLKVGIIGAGPIGKAHLQLLCYLLGGSKAEISVFDLDSKKRSAISQGEDIVVRPVDSWEEAYSAADIFITCTVSKHRYISMPPKKGSLQLNISLRDYLPEVRKYMDVVVVDDWEEICRENTDVEVMYKMGLLQKEAASTLSEVVLEGLLHQCGTEDTIMFNPMGMAIFDMCIAGYVYRAAQSAGVGQHLAD